MLIDILHNYQIPLQIIVSKTDKSNQSLKSKLKRDAKNILLEEEYNNLLFYSSLDLKTVEKVVIQILNMYKVSEV